MKQPLRCLSAQVEAPHSDQHRASTVPQNIRPITGKTRGTGRREGAVERCTCSRPRQEHGKAAAVRAGWKTGRERRDGVIGRALSTSLRAVYLLLFTQKMRLYRGTSDTLVLLSQSEAAAAAQLPASRFTHKSAKRSAAGANGDGGREEQPKELRRPTAGGLNVTSALINSSLGQTEVVQ